MSDCIYCKEEIIDGSKFCKHCNHYQCAWQNWIPHIGGVVALALLLLSIAGFLIRPVRDAYKKLTWRDKVEVVCFGSNEGITIKNSGDGEVFVESVSFRNKNNTYSGGMTIMVPAEQGEFTTYRVKEPILGTVIQEDEKFEENEVSAVFCSPNNNVFRGFKSHLNAKIRTFECEAELNYYSLEKKGILKVEIPCIGYLIKKTIS